MENVYCTSCHEFTHWDIKVTYPETRETPEETEAICSACGDVDTFDEESVPCVQCEERPALDGYDECDDCLVEE